MKKYRDSGFWILFLTLGKLFGFFLTNFLLSLVLYLWNMLRVVSWMNIWEGGLKPHLLQLHTPTFWLLKTGEEPTLEVGIIETKVKASQGPSTRMLHVFIVTREGISRNIVTGLRTKWDNKRKITIIKIVLLLLLMTIVLLLQQKFDDNRVATIVSYLLLNHLFFD